MIQIKKGTVHPNNKKVDISNWKGTLNNHINKEKEVLICLDLDNETISNMPEEYIHYCKINNLNHTQLWINQSKVEYI